MAGVVSEAEAAVRGLNDTAHPALAPLARLLLRTESIASSKIEGAARRRSRVGAGRGQGRFRWEGECLTAREVLANIDAMELAIERSRVTADLFTVDRDRSRSTAASWSGRSTPSASLVKSARARTGSAGTTTTPAVRLSCPPPPEEVPGLLGDLCRGDQRRRAAPARAGRARACPVRDHPPVRRRQRTDGSRTDSRRAQTASRWRSRTCRRSAWCWPPTGTGMSKGSPRFGGARERLGRAIRGGRPRRGVVGLGVSPRSGGTERDLARTVGRPGDRASRGRGCLGGDRDLARAPDDHGAGRRCHHRALEATDLRGDRATRACRHSGAAVGVASQSVLGSGRPPRPARATGIRWPLAGPTPARVPLALPPSARVPLALPPSARPLRAYTLQASRREHPRRESFATRDAAAPRGAALAPPGLNYNGGSGVRAPRSSDARERGRPPSEPPSRVAKDSRRGSSRREA